MNTLIMWVMACGAAVGGLDRILGNRFGLGKRFEEGYELLGASALSMAGIICLVPLLTLGLEKNNRAFLEAPWPGPRHAGRYHRY